MTVDPDVKRAQARERMLRFRAAHPDYRKEENRKTRAAQNELRRMHPEVFDRLKREGREKGWGRHKARDRALSALARMHPDEWRILRRTTK